MHVYQPFRCMFSIKPWTGANYRFLLVTRRWKVFRLGRFFLCEAETVCPDNISLFVLSPLPNKTLTNVRTGRDESEPSVRFLDLSSCYQRLWHSQLLDSPNMSLTVDLVINMLTLEKIIMSRRGPLYPSKAMSTRKNPSRSLLKSNIRDPIS